VGERLLDSAEVAELLHVNVRTLTNWAYLRTGPQYFKIGNRRRYRRADVDAWLEAQAVKTG